MRTLAFSICVLLYSVAAGAMGTKAPNSHMWYPARPSLFTRWAKDVSPDNAHQEYPRPQMVRADWLNLNGLWDYAIRSRDKARPKKWDGKILVPFPIESALSGVRKRVDQDQRLWYRRTFEAPSTWLGKRVLLHFGAVDWEATVWVNGKKMGTHRGGYDAFTLDITEALKADGPQELIVKVYDPTDSGEQPRGKQDNNPRGILYTPSTGIWQTPWLEPVPASSIAGLHLVPDVEACRLLLTVVGRRTSGAHTVGAVALDGGKEVARAVGKIGSEIKLPIRNAKLWSAENPFLYDLKVTLREDGRGVDSVTSYFGMRTIRLGKDDKGITRILLNGKPIFQVGALDQGFWPDGLYTAPCDEALRYDIEVTKQLGFNMARKHVKVEPARWYYWCDKLGLLVWQDMPSGRNESPESRMQFERELKWLVEGFGNHPSIIMWIVFNEGWGQYDTERLTKSVKAMDPTRLVSNASGWTDKKVGDIIDVHCYPGPGSPSPEEKRAAVLGEFGGLGLAIDGHQWEEKNWGYLAMSDAKALTRHYVKLLRKVHELKSNPGLCAAVYTQITDVETECNGLLTYDRAVIKVDVVKIANANRGEFPPVSVTRTVVPDARSQAIF